jgi:UDP-N-acetylglucosamine 2-epimerase (non-hydrolysing)
MKILLFFGTRPETVKLAPVLRELQACPRIKPIVCVSTQHRELLEQALQVFSIVPDYNLGIMTAGQSLFRITRLMLAGIEPILEKEHPDLLLVQGDTTTAFVGAIASYYCRIPVAHVEAGLRTFDPYAPFPEEMNRCLIDQLAALHFAPTSTARDNLLAAGISRDTVFVTGNTEIDALQFVRAHIPPRSRFTFPGKVILVTAHRRESFSGGIARICHALEQLAQRNKDISIVYPVHPNPNVREVAETELSKQQRINLIPPLDYASFVHLMADSALVLTDSGGIQEAAAALHIPTLVLRDKTERIEGLNSGAAQLVGTDPKRIVAAAENLLHNPQAHEQMAKASNPYGNGDAAIQIRQAIEARFL